MASERARAWFNRLPVGGWLERLAPIRQNKPLLFALMGLVGGAIGALLAEFAPHFHFGGPRMEQTLYTGLWTAVSASVLTTALFLAGEVYHRKLELIRHFLAKSLLAGAIAGAIAGSVAEAVYGSHGEVEYWRELILRPLCWGLLGGLLGWRLSGVLPNLGWLRGVIGGSAGGVVGGIGFLLMGILFPQFVGRMAGFGVLGAGLGLSVVTVEAMFRHASLEIVWAPNEVTSLTLGSQPIYIGGGDDHVPVVGLPQHAASIALDKGRIRYTDLVTGRKTDLQNGSRIKIGRLELVINARGESAAAVEPGEKCPR